MKLLNLCNVYSVYDVNATVWFIADCIICETVVTCMMFCRHITRNSVTAIINVPFHCTFRCLIELLVHTSTPKCWNSVELETNVMIHSSIHRKVLSLIIHIVDFDWTLVYRYSCFCAHMRTLN